MENIFPVSELPDDAVLHISVDGSRAAVFEFKLLTSSPIRKLLELQEIYEAAWKQGKDAKERANEGRVLPRYKCHKEVSALKIKQVVIHAHPDPSYDDDKWIASDEFQGGHIFPEEAGFNPIPFDAAWYRKHKPVPGGYYVVYKDGYTSFSPAQAFEEGYALIG